MSDRDWSVYPDPDFSHVERGVYPDPTAAECAIASHLKSYRGLCSRSELRSIACSFGCTIEWDDEEEGQV